MFAVDDDIESSPKFEALDTLPSARRSRAFEAWVRLGAACRKRGNGGLVTPFLLAKVLATWAPAERRQAVFDLAAARGGRSHGLLEPDGDGWRFHEWARWQPTAEESSAERQARTKGAERTRRWRLNKSLGNDEQASPVTSRAASRGDAGDVTGASRGDAGDVSRARDPLPSPPVPSRETENLSTSGDLDQVARAPEQPAGSLSRDAETIRKALAEAFEAADVRPAPRAVRDLDGKPWVELVEPLRATAAREGVPLERVAARLGTGFLASPRARKAHFPIAWLVANPREYLAPANGVSDFSHVDPSVDPASMLVFDDEGGSNG